MGISCVLPSSFSIPMGSADSGTAGAGRKKRGKVDFQVVYIHCTCIPPILNILTSDIAMSNENGKKLCGFFP